MIDDHIHVRVSPPYVMTLLNSFFSELISTSLADRLVGLLDSS